MLVRLGLVVESIHRVPPTGFSSSSFGNFGIYNLYFTKMAHFCWKITFGALILGVSWREHCILCLCGVACLWNHFLGSVVRYFEVRSSWLGQNYANFRIFEELLLTVRRGAGLVSDGERCYNMVRYWAVLGAGLCSWCALCRNGVVVRDGANCTIFCFPHSFGMTFFLLGTGNDGESWVRYAWAWAASFWLIRFFVCSFYWHRYRWGWNLLLLDANCLFCG